MRRFEYRDATSSKFWSIELQGESFTVHFGRIGTKGQTQRKTFPDADTARREHDKLIRQKLAKGYTEQAAAAATSALQQALEEALTANPDDLATHHAYADYLSEQSDPDLAARSELIAVQLALEDPARRGPQRKQLQERESALLAEHGRRWLGELAPFCLDQAGVHEFYLEHDRGYGFRFARGWIDYLRLHELSSATARALRSNPLLRLLRHLVILRHDYDAPGFEELMECPYLGNLRAFQLGPEGDSCHMNGEHAVDLVEKMPLLEDLRLFAHRVDVERLFALPLPHLRVLYVYHLHEYPLEVLADNPTLGNLTQLACWPHALEPGDNDAYIQLEGVRALVHSPHLKKLTHLQLRLSDTGDEGCEEMVRSGILGRLCSLDLTGGRVTDVGARILADCRELRHLERLDLTNNMLTGAGIAALRKAGVTVEADQQFEYDPDDDEKEYLFYGDCE